jgi:1,4-alpha-glucan branching enzyme
MHAVFALHTHLPWVLGHGRWPHGSDWVCEAALETYLPLLEALGTLELEGTPTPLTIGITPVLANMLASPVFAQEFEAFLDQRTAAARDGAAALAGTPEASLVPLGHWWEARIRRLRGVWERLDRDLAGAFRALADRGRVELMTSAATHGLLPLLGRDESIRLQLSVGKREFRRVFGREAQGIWLPECAYRPRGPWRVPGVAEGPVRRGLDEHLADFDFHYFFADAHMARAGAPLGVYGEPSGGWPVHVVPQWTEGDARQTPYRAYRVSSHHAAHDVAAFVRDPRSSAQVWSRHGGYPGAGAYLEFHKIRFPGGLRFWRVTGQGVDLGQKQTYDPQAAMSQAVAHGRHFASLLGDVAAGAGAGRETVVVAPFDTELFGHWWFEGPEFLAATCRALRHEGRMQLVTASDHLAQHPATHGLALASGSWGKHGDWTMWVGPAVTWMWPVLWRLEVAFWKVAPVAIGIPDARTVLAQAARSLLLAQSSDWPFIVSTGEVADYGIARFKGHVEDTEALLRALDEGIASGSWDGATTFAESLSVRDHLFPDVLDDVAVALGLA